jgi:hypothetical protein
MKTAVDFIRSHVIPWVSFGMFLCIEGFIIYGLYLAIVKH